MAVSTQTGSKLKGSALAGNKAQDLADFFVHVKAADQQVPDPYAGGWMLQK